MSKRTCRVGLVGLGTVGGGVAEILLGRADLLERRSGAPVSLAAVAELDATRMEAERIPPALRRDDYRRIVEDPEVDVVVELVGGTGVAEAVVRESLEAGKAVITANKALLAEKGRPLFALAREKGLPLAFEAAVAGGIPIILALREGLVANRFDSLLGIVNGTCNYILTEMIDKGAAYEACLAEAQRLGYAEADPTFDVEGNDAGHKLALLSALAMETWIDYDQLHVEGITGIDLTDVTYARALGYTPKLLAVARPAEGTLFLSVHPGLLPSDHPLAAVKGSMNAVALHGDRVLESVYYGRGAGRTPTASAVVADVVAVARSLAMGGYVPLWSPGETPAFTLGAMEDYRTRYYLRFRVEDRCGVLGRIATLLGEHDVSIAMVHQYAGPPEAVPLILVTHEAREGNVRAALEAIEREPFARSAPVLLRMEA